MPEFADDFPRAQADEREMYLDWLRFLRGAILRKVEGLTEEQARWTPDGALLPLLGLVNHLTNVEQRWIEGRMRGVELARDEAEFFPGPEITLDDAIERYRARTTATDSFVRSTSLESPCPAWEEGTNLRWVLVHLINETARHAGHADATRELVDGTTGE
jgi:uncharacterized damage-inducible protein DinB